MLHWLRQLYWSYQNAFRMGFFANNNLIITFISKVECANLILACHVLCHTSLAVIKTSIVEKCKHNQSYLTPFKRPSVSSDT